MMFQPRLNSLISATTKQFGDISSHFSHVTLPKRLNGHQNVQIASLWTKDGLRPRWGNLAAVADFAQSPDNLEWWHEFLTEFEIPLGMLVVPEDYLFLSRTPNGKIKSQQISAEELPAELARQRDALFTPRALGKLRTGQLSFADLEESVTPESFAFLTRQRKQLDKALQDAILGAMAAQDARGESDEAVLTVAIAYLAARILEDKGFFGPQQMPTYDPKALLQRTVERTDGFFTRAFKQKLPLLSDSVLQQLALHLGAGVTFTLVDHLDVALMYEHVAQVLSKTANPDRAGLIELQQHYTPIAIARRMVEYLPLERLRPEERTIFDPAAGSGTLLLAATSRLASMSDIPTGEKRASYLSQHIVGNDIDPVAALVTQLRYTLVQETFGQTDLFPTPAHFGKQDYRSYSKETLPIKPRVIVANPPFAQACPEERGNGNVQRAVQFVEHALTWLSDGDQFAFVLPQTFLTGSTYGYRQTRKELAERCHLFECWQLPEGVVGLTAQQPVCIVLAEVGKSISRHTIGKAILSRASRNVIQENGFLGQAWVAEVAQDSADWASVVAPPISIPVPTVSLNELYQAYIGVTPRPSVSPVKESPEGVKVKRYWKHSWREHGRLWIDPQCINDDERYILYGQEFLKRRNSQYEHLYDLPKIMIGRTVNRGSKEPLVVCLDTIGFCPNNNVYCVSIRNTEDKMQTLLKWSPLSDEKKRLWLLGILSSDLARDLSLSKRNTRHLSMTGIRNFPLPAQVDPKIIELTRAMVERDQRREAISDPDPLRQALNQAVEASYGNPYRMELVRTGVLPDLKWWEEERKKRSFTVSGQVLEVSPDNRQILLHLIGLLDDEEEAWITLPSELPGWALDGTVFEAELSEDVETFDELTKRPWALREFQHTPRPYLTLEELMLDFADSLGMELEL